MRNPTVEDMNQICIPDTRRITVLDYYAVTSLLQPFRRFAHLHTVSAAPLGGSSVVDEQNLQNTSSIL